MDCYSCKWRGRIPGDTHSCCKHPQNGGALDDPLASMFAIFAGVGRSAPQVAQSAIALGIEINPHGLRNGWANWPWNFDPVWIKSCNGFESRNPDNPNDR